MDGKSLVGGGSLVGWWWRMGSWLDGWVFEWIGCGVVGSWLDGGWVLG